MKTAMKTLVDQLSRYAAYHRDRRSIATHFIGIPMIVQAVVILLARPSVDFLGLQWSLASLGVIASVIYYLRLDLRYGTVMGVLSAAGLAMAGATTALPLASWLTLGVSLFVVGWVLQFIGHYYEGRKPAFVDDLMGLAIGPLFVVAEAGFIVGLRPEVKAAIEARAGIVTVGRERVHSSAGA
jgi:uncharacterized membrane protein YGL010W